MNMKSLHSTIRKFLNEIHDMNNQEPMMKTYEELKSFLRGYKLGPGSTPLEGNSFIVIGPVKSKTLSSGKFALNQMYKSKTAFTKSWFFFKEEDSELTLYKIILSN